MPSIAVACAGAVADEEELWELFFELFFATTVPMWMLLFITIAILNLNVADQANLRDRVAVVRSFTNTHF